MERKFYDSLLSKGQQVVEDLKNSKGGLSGNYMNLLTMLLRLRQATDHVDLLKGKVGDPDETDELVSMMGGLGIETKCSVCFTMYVPFKN